MREDQSPAPSSERGESKRVYQPPDVEEIGSLARITAGPAGGTLDLLFGSDGGFQGTS